MLLPPEAFVHVPALLGKVIAPEASFFRLSRTWLTDLDRVARENGYPANWRLSDAEREATRAGVLARRGRDLWVFAYGSLLWDPGIHIVEIRTATLSGFHRRARQNDAAYLLFEQRINRHSDREKTFAGSGDADPED